MKRLNKNAVIIALAVLLCVSLGANAVLAVRERRMATHMIMQHQREMTDVVAAMADIEINLSKLLIASGAAQSVSLLEKPRCWLSMWKAGWHACP